MRQDLASWGLSLYDPPRGFRGTIQTAQAMSQVSGADHAAIAKRLPGRCIWGQHPTRLNFFWMITGSGVVDQADSCPGFRSTSSLSGFSGRGHIVGMTGDRVNEPGLKRCRDAVEGATGAADRRTHCAHPAGLSVSSMPSKRPQNFQRMQSYAIYRIAGPSGCCSLYLAILVFNFTRLPPS
jgi:hypothetical protein